MLPMQLYAMSIDEHDSCPTYDIKLIFVPDVITECIVTLLHISEMPHTTHT